MYFSDECGSSPCQFSGSCTDGVNGYTCTCVAGYIGLNCETNIGKPQYFIFHYTYISNSFTASWCATVTSFGYVHWLHIIPVFIKVINFLTICRINTCTSVHISTLIWLHEMLVHVVLKVIWGWFEHIKISTDISI